MIGKNCQYCLFKEMHVPIRQVVAQMGSINRNSLSIGEYSDKIPIYFIVSEGRPTMHGTFLNPLAPGSVHWRIEERFPSVRIIESNFVIAALIQIVKECCLFPISRIFRVVLQLA